jgi:hypothetical protein
MLKKRYSHKKEKDGNIMEMFKRFYHEIKEVENNDICISFYKKRGTQDSYARDYIILSRYSIPELISLLKSPEFIPLREKGSFKNKYDFIQIGYGGHDGTPSLHLMNGRFEITGNGDDVFSVYIPIDAFQTNDFQYLDPLIEDLRKYIIE